MPNKTILSAPELKRSAKTISVQSLTSEGEFSGYASVFNKADLSNDIVLAGAFSQSLQNRAETGIRMLWQHDATQPIGTWLTIKEDAYGLFVRGKLNLAVKKGREAYALLKEGGLNGLSIGYNVQKSHKAPKTAHRYLERVDLWEISLVTFPMLHQARVHSLKSAAQDALLQAILRATQALKTH